MVLVLVGTSYLVGFTPAGELMGLYARFLWNVPYYNRVVTTLLAQGPAARDRTQLAADCEVDEGPPVRVAFSWDGILDNWSGIVYDPTGVVLQANEFKDDWSNWDDPNLGSVKRLFGGDLRRAVRLWGNWYYCVFT